MSDSYEDLVIRRRELLNQLKADSNPQSPLVPDSEPMSVSSDTEWESDLYQFYREYYLRKYMEPAYSPSEWKWLDGVRAVAGELQNCVSTVTDEIDGIEKENLTMVSELSGLDEKSKRLLGEQDLIEKRVNDLESKMITVSAIRDVNLILNDRDLIVTDFPLFEKSIKELVAAFTYVSSTPDQVLGLSRQLENLRSRVCSTAVFVCTSAIEIYTRRMQVIVSEKSTVNTSALYNRHTDTLNVVGKVCEVFRRYEWSDPVSEIEKPYFESRSKILGPIMNAYMTQTIASLNLSAAVRKTVYFINSIIDQELMLYRNYAGKLATSPSMHLNILLRDLSAWLYNPLRTSVITCMDLNELRESAEIIRLEIIPDKSREIAPTIISLVYKLHRDIQERLIYRIEAFIRDEIRSSSVPETMLEKTKECLSVITGVLDPLTFHEISNEALTACVDVLISVPGKDEGSRLKLIAQLLQLRERVTMIDCEYSLMAISSPLFDQPGLTDTIRRLVNRSTSSTPNSGAVTPEETSVRVRIELVLRTLCDEFSALVIATVMTRSGDEKLSEYLRSVQKQINEIFSFDPSIEHVLVRPIVAELKSNSTVPPPVVEMVEGIFK